MHTNLKIIAIQLRKKGYLYSEIAKELQVAKSTAYTWTSSIELDNNQAVIAAEKLRSAQVKNIKNLAALKITRNEQRNRLIRKNAVSIISKARLNINHKRLLCSVLFWCEGGKNTDSGIRFINSDPIMIKTFLWLLRTSFKLDERKFRALIHLHDYHDETKQLQYWSSITQIPASQFNRPYRKPHTGQNIREGYPGCISIRYLDSSLGKLLKMIYSEFGKL